MGMIQFRIFSNFVWEHQNRFRVSSHFFFFLPAIWTIASRDPQAENVGRFFFLTVAARYFEILINVARNSMKKKFAAKRWMASLLYKSYTFMLRCIIISHNICEWCIVEKRYCRQISKISHCNRSNSSLLIFKTSLNYTRKMNFDFFFFLLGS